MHLMFYQYPLKGGENMSFSVSVSISHENAGLRNIEAPILYEDEVLGYIIYDEPVAGDSSFFEYWHVISIKCKLNLFSRIYKYGFRSSDRFILEQLKNEISIIETIWSSMNIDTPKLEQLQEGYRDLDFAISLSIREGGILDIS